MQELAPLDLSAVDIMHTLPLAVAFLFGLAATIKLPLLLIGAYFVVRRRWMIVAGGGTAIAIAALLSLAAFGIDDHIRWYNDTIGLTMWRDGFAGEAPSLRAEIGVHLIAATPVDEVLRELLRPLWPEVAESLP